MSRAVVTVLEMAMALFAWPNQFKSKSKFLLHLPAKTWVQALGVLRFSFVGENDITNTPETAGNAENVAPKIGDTINCPERTTTFPRAEALKVKRLVSSTVPDVSK